MASKAIDDDQSNADALASRKRGRPRTGTEDPQVPEKRRTQLRVAQRAYRKRKETTIVNLQSRVQELESGIEALSESFLSFSELLFDVGILQNQPRVTAALQKITQQCVSLAKSGCSDAEQAPAASADESPSTSPTVGDTRTRETTSIDNPLTTPLGSLPIIGDGFHSTSDPAAQWPALSQLPPTPPLEQQAILPYGIDFSSPKVVFSSMPSPAFYFPTKISPDNLIKQRRWTLSHYLIRQCCETGYYLLTSPMRDDPIVEAVFGKRLTVDERNLFISRFIDVLHDDVGNLIELGSKVLSSRRNSYTPEQLAVSSQAWQIVNESAADEWLDASGVQRLLQQRGIDMQDSSSPLPGPGPRFNSAPQINVASFVQFLSFKPVCLGRGVAFRKRDVEHAIRLATVDDPWALNAVCEIP